MVTTGNFYFTTFSFLSLLYFSRDLSFTISTSFSILLFPHPAFLVATFGLVLRPKQSNPIKTTTTQFIFIMQIFNKIIHYASHSKFKHHNKLKFPQTFNHAIKKTKFKIKKNVLPFFVSDADWKLDCRCSPFCTSFIVLQN